MMKLKKISKNFNMVCIPSIMHISANNVPVNVNQSVYPRVSSTLVRGSLAAVARPPVEGLSVPSSLRPGPRLPPHDQLFVLPRLSGSFVTCHTVTTPTTT